MSPYERVPCFAEHSCPVQCHPHHPAQHDALHPLSEGRPRVPAGHRLLGHPDVLQLRLWPRNHHLHWDEQDQGYCHQRSYLHGEALSAKGRSSVMSRFSYLLSLILQQQIIYYLCVLLKDPSDPDAASSVVPLFQVRLIDFRRAVLRVLLFSLVNGRFFFTHHISLSFRVPSQGWTVWWRFTKAARRFF